MLEHPTLLIKPRQQEQGQVRRLILAADSRQPVGFVCWRQGLRWWHRWLPWGFQTIHEHEDEPLLCIIRRCVSILPWWEIQDADRKLVGHVLLPELRDKRGRLVGKLCQQERTPTFADPRGNPLGWIDLCEEGVQLTFPACPLGDPFLKMLLLAAALQAGQAQKSRH